ncbi:hypothetical protein [Haloplanus halophilus]|uniref:hypothetical protein n=1 Tax=Haloplanus halophilus TaxID=2949993 RepID=UPI00203D9253|nr:hypothetical protein [Haloplanus sp. GDY1]
MSRHSALPSARRQVGLIVGAFAAVGVALGVVGFVVSRWARTQFVTAATGADPTTFGPVFLALSTFQTTVTLFFAGPVVAAALGLLSGSRFADAGTGGLVAAAGALVGFFVMAGAGLAGISLLSGPGTGQTYALAGAVGPLLLSGVATAATGGVAGLLGSRFVR